MVKEIDFSRRGIVRVWPDADAVATAASDVFASTVKEAVAARGRALIALSGGSTPRNMERLLGASPYKEAIPWSDIEIFWGDERWVPESSTESNAGEAKRVLLNTVPIPPEHIHTIVTIDVDPNQAAENYETTVREVFGQSRRIPAFDLIFLGLGEDGHTASLFPGTAVVYEKNRLVLAHYVDKLKMYRVTFTPTLINAARKVVFLVSGDGKTDILANVVQNREEPDRWPAQIVHPTTGTLEWFVDRAAAAALTEVRS